MTLEFDVFTSNQVAHLLGTNSNNLRTLKSRKSDILEEGMHWFRGESAETIWTRSGLLVLCDLVNTVQAQKTKRKLEEANNNAIAVTERNVPVANSNGDVATSNGSVATSNATVAMPNPSARYENLPETLAHAIAAKGLQSGWIERVDRTVASDLLNALVESPFSFSFDDVLGDT